MQILPASERSERVQQKVREYETLVVDGPHMDRRIELEYETVWEGTRGWLEVEDAWLA